MFPGSVSLTDQSTIEIVGQFSTADASEVETVVFIDQQGFEVAATVDANGQWRATLPLINGTNNIQALTTSLGGSQRTQELASVRSQLLLTQASDLEINSDGTLLYALDQSQIIEFDIENQTQRVVTQLAASDPFSFVDQTTLTRLADNELILLRDRELFSLDTRSGALTPLAELPSVLNSIPGSDLTDTLPGRFRLSIGGPQLLAADLVNGRVFAGAVGTSLFSFDLTDPSSIVTENLGVIPAGDAPSLVSSLVYDPSRNELSFSNGFNSQLTRVLLNPFQIEERSIELLGIPLQPFALTSDPLTGELLAASAVGGLHSVNPESAVANVLSFSASASADGADGAAVVIGLAATESTIFQLTASPNKLSAVDRNDGGITTISSSQLGDGPALLATGGMRWNAAAQRLFIVNATGLIQLDPRTGDRTEVVALLTPAVASTTGETSLTPANISIVVNQAGTKAWLSGFDQRVLVEVDIPAGSQRTISGVDEGGGPLPLAPTALVLNSDEDTVYLADAQASQVYAIDLASGNRFVVATTEDNSRITGLAIDGLNNRLLLNIAAPFIPAFGFRQPIDSIVEVRPRIAALDLNDLMLSDVLTLDNLSSQGEGVIMIGPSIRLSSDGRQLFYVGLSTTIIRLDLVTGRTFAIGSPLSGPESAGLQALEFDDQGRLYVLDRSGALFTVDPGTGQRAIVAK